MCGIAGFFDPASFEAYDAARVAGRMSETLRHRGPDDAGVWVDGRAGVALAHRRLAILDLSDAGHQPMTSACGRYVITYNGEVYNNLELRRELRKRAPEIAWRGHSDTETLLEAISSWGVEGALERSVGMFAFGVWDRANRALTLARDRVGEKPLYYGWLGSSFVFGSELKALRAHPAFGAEIDRDALALFFRHNYVPAPWSIYKGVWKLPPGCLLTIDARSTHDSGNPSRYWSPRHVATEGLLEPFDGNDADASDELERLLRQSIAGQMIADVPVAAFLSGGLDSSTIVALMQTQSAAPVKTISIGFHVDDYNEADHAARIAKHLGTEHIELYVTPQKALDVVPHLPNLYDEPFADSSQVPTFLMTGLTRQHVTVALSGDGGDELFGGYNRYYWAMEVWRKVGPIPARLKTVASSCFRFVPPEAWDRLFRKLQPLIPKRFRYNSPGDKIHKLASILNASDPAEIYRELISHWSPPTNLVLNAYERPTAVTDRAMWLEDRTFAERMMFLDLVSYLPDDILVKVDRAAMGASLETRIPMLDHRVIEFAWRLPLAQKVRSGEGKQILRNILNRYVPRELVERPKMGFGIPIDSWLRDSLKGWAENLLDEKRLLSEGFLNAAFVRAKWDQHQSGRSNWAYHLWDVLMFQAWLETLSGWNQPRTRGNFDGVIEIGDAAYA